MHTYIVRLKLPTGQPEVKISADAVSTSTGMLTFSAGPDDVAQFTIDSIAGWWRDSAIQRG